MAKVLIFGPGWLGHKFKERFGAELSKADIGDRRAVAEALDHFKPDVVINTAGKTGHPNIDWCEDHKGETVYSNITGPLILARVCEERKIYWAHLSSGCIYSGAPAGRTSFTETDPPNPVSFYAITKAVAEEVLIHFPVLVLRLRMPLDKLPSPRNLITKLSRYPKVIDVENSITLVEDLLLAAQKLIEKRKTGFYNVVNPGPVKHGEIMTLYTQIVDPAHRYELIPAEELQSRGLAKTGRSNCILDTAKLEAEGIQLRPALPAIREALLEYRAHFVKA